MSNLRRVCEAAQPLTIGRGVGREIQHHGNSRSEHVRYQRAEHLTDLPGMSDVVGNRIDLLRVKLGQPVIFAEQNG